MRDPHRGLGLVHVLAAGAGRAIGVDPQVLGPDLDLGVALDLGRRVDKRERRLPALLEIERRDAHEPVRAALGLEIPVRVIAFNRQRRAPESGLVPRRGLEELRLEATALRPTEVHADEHLGPIRRVGATDAGRDRHDRVALVVRPRELRLEGGVRNLFGELGNASGHFGFELGVVAREPRKLREVLRPRAITLPLLEARAHMAETLQGLLSALPVLPEIRLGSVAL